MFPSEHEAHIRSSTNMFRESTPRPTRDVIQIPFPVQVCPPGRDASMPSQNPYQSGPVNYLLLSFRLAQNILVRAAKDRVPGDICFKGKAGIERKPQKTGYPARPQGKESPEVPSAFRIPGGMTASGRFRYLLNSLKIRDKNQESLYNPATFRFKPRRSKK